MNENDEVKLKITAIGDKGDPLGRIDGMVVIVKDCKKFVIGEYMNVKITKIYNKVMFALPV